MNDRPLKLRLQTPLLVLLCLLGVALPAVPRQADDARPAPMPMPMLQLIALELAVGDAVPPDLQCQPRATPPLAAATPAAAPLTEIPDAQEVESALLAAEPASAPPAAGAVSTRLALPGNGAAYRVAVWGDSHMAAAFFTDALARILAPALGPASGRFVPAGVGHGGVRGLVRKVCLSSGWTRETAHARSAAAQAPGPGLVSLLAQEPGASLVLDMRDGHGQPRHRALQILFGPTAQAVTVAVSVNDGDETTLVLPATATASDAAIDLHTNAALSTLKLRLVQGALRLQGLRLGEAPPVAGLQLDVLAYPGATALGWARADLGLLRAWFDAEPYDLVLLAYGTNEGNDPRYNASAYREMLLRAVGQMRQVFPQARCLLVGPGDRGVRVAKNRAKVRKPARKFAPDTVAARAAAHKATAARVDLLKYAHIHEEINRIQQAVAAQQGCSAWDMQARMGGRGAAYKWARSSPALMAPDLIHFTAAGYRELAQRFAADVGWSDR